MKKQKKTNVALNLPCIVCFEVYSDRAAFEYNLQQLSTRLKCDWIGGSEFDAIVYTKKDKAYKNLIIEHVANNTDYMSDIGDSDA